MKRRIAFMMMLIGGLLTSGFVVWATKADDDAAPGRKTRHSSVAVERLIVNDRGDQPRIAKIKWLRKQYIRQAETHATKLTDVEELEDAIEELNQEIKAVEAKQAMQDIELRLRHVINLQTDTEAGKAAQRAWDAVKSEQPVEPREASAQEAR